MSVGTLIERLKNAKEDLKSIIQDLGLTVGDELIDKYANLVDGLNGILSVTSKTIQTSSTTTANISYNPNIGIIDSENKLWDTLDWHQRWVNNGYSADGLSTPVGIWMRAWGEDCIKLLWPIISPYTYYDVSGTLSLGTTGYRHFTYNNSQITTEKTNIAVWPANQSGNISHGTAGKYNASTWSSAITNTNDITIICNNTEETFVIPNGKNLVNANALAKSNNEEYMEGYYILNEFFRSLYAICSGIGTGEEDGTINTVEILNSEGKLAAVGEDMYFWIEGINTGLLAKYNLNSRPNDAPTTALLTLAIADAIYAAQKTAGINMNDTGVNSSTKRILTYGAKGAEAVAVNGFWYIKTPYVSNVTATFSVNNNCLDSPVVYLCKAHNVSLPTEKWLYPYYLNKQTHITAIVNLLRTIEGLLSIVPTVVSSTIWGSIRYNAATSWYIGSSVGNVATNGTYGRSCVVPCPLGSVAFTKV